MVESLESRTVLSAMVMPAHFAPEHEFSSDQAARDFDSPQPTAKIAEFGVRPSTDLGYDSRRLEQTPLTAPGPTPIDPKFENTGFRSEAMPPRDAGGPGTALGRGNAVQRDIGRFDTLSQSDPGPDESPFWDAAPRFDDQAATFATEISSWHSSPYQTSAWSSLQTIDQTMPGSGTVMTGVLHVEIVVPSSNVLFSLLTISAFAEPQSGLVGLGSRTAENNTPRLGTFAASRARDSAPSENVPLRSSFAADSFNTIGSRSTGPLLRDPDKQPVFNPLLEIPSFTTAATSGGEGGLLRLSANQTITISNWIVTGTVNVAPQGASIDFSVLARTEPRLSESRDELTQTDWYDLDGGLTTSASRQIASIAGDMEGGMIDVGATRETSSSPNKPALTRKPEATGKPSCQRIANEYAERPDLNESRETADSVDSTEAPQETSRHDADAVNQGGMIALMSPAISVSGAATAESGMWATAQSASRFSPGAFGDGDVQMDAGVGLYQVFELATAPGQLADQPLTSNRTTTGQTHPQGNSTSTPSISSEQTAGQPHADHDGLGGKLLRLATTIPAVLFLASLPIRRTAWRKPAMRIVRGIRFFAKRFIGPRS